MLVPCHLHQLVRTRASPYDLHQQVNIRSSACTVLSTPTGNHTVISMYLVIYTTGKRTVTTCIFLAALMSSTPTGKHRITVTCTCMCIKHINHLHHKLRIRQLLKYVLFVLLSHHQQVRNMAIIHHVTCMLCMTVCVTCAWCVTMYVTCFGV